MTNGLPILGGWLGLLVLIALLVWVVLRRTEPPPE
jgi:hypothetical protein